MTEIADGLPDFEWVEVAGGCYWMGGGPRDEENPRHRVRVDDFRLARTQVTRAQYGVFCAATTHPLPPFWTQIGHEHQRMPVVGASWHDAVAFCSWATVAAGVEVRLPTEAEWERAATAGREVTYPWGHGEPRSLPDYDRRWSVGPEVVDAYPSQHPLGFLGLGENIHEWCSDWYQADYYQASPVDNPRGPSSGRRKASRGGSWRHAIKVSRCTARSSIPPEFRYNDYGFRLATEAH